MGWNLLGAVVDGDIKPDDIIIMLSLNGTQLYQILLNMSPDKHYKKINVIPGGFIPGPNKPKCGLIPLSWSALQREGLTVWDANCNAIFRSDIYVLYETADGPRLVYWNGMVRHCGKNGCQIYCRVRGRRKTKQNHYLAVLLKLRDHACFGSNHPDIIASPNACQYDLIKTDTGLTKPPLVLGLQPSHSLGIPFSVTTDIMNLIANLADLMLFFW
ncbi:hypothetical protein BS17DRAFT_798335 [Gyrodon lividus]|nr:hypothetical protein BS17DRAFT_798335 [Gyrodon lividus]